MWVMIRWHVEETFVGKFYYHNELRWLGPWDDPNVFGLPTRLVLK